MAAHCSTLACRIPCTEESAKLQSMGCTCDWSDSAHRHTQRSNTIKDAEEKTENHCVSADLQWTLTTQLKCLGIQTKISVSRTHWSVRLGDTIWSWRELCNFILSGQWQVPEHTGLTVEDTQKTSLTLCWWQFSQHKTVVHKQSLPLTKLISKWLITISHLPLLTLANGPSTSIELWANSGPRNDCWSWIILPMEGSLPKAPPVQYSHWVPAAVKQISSDENQIILKLQNLIKYTQQDF